VKKSVVWCLMSAFWAVNAILSIVRFFNIRITVWDKKGRKIKAISRQGDRLTGPRVVTAALYTFLCNLCAGLYFMERKKECLAKDE